METKTEAHHSGSWSVRGAMAVGILGISAAAILVRWAGDRGIPSLSVASHRMVYAALVLLIFAWPTRRQLLRAIQRHVGWFLFSAVCLALHFGLFTEALYRVEVARAVVLVETQPIFVVLAAWWFLGERPSALLLAFVVVAIGGVFWMSAGQFGHSQGAGDWMALGGAMSMAGYILATRRLRREVSLTHYAGPVYLVAGLLLAVAALLRGDSMGPFGPRDHLLFVALAVIPTLCGHTLFNWAAAFVPARTISMAFLGEPPGAALLAFVFFQEVPATATVVGGLICLAGVAGVLTMRER